MFKHKKSVVNEFRLLKISVVKICLLLTLGVLYFWLGLHGSSTRLAFIFTVLDL